MEIFVNVFCYILLDVGIKTNWYITQQKKIFFFKYWGEGREMSYYIENGENSLGKNYTTF